MNLANLPQRIRARLLVEANVAGWRRDTAVLRAMPNGAPCGTVLICALMTNVATSKAEAIYAAALRQHGYRIVVLLPIRSAVIEKVHAAAGAAHIVSFAEEARAVDRDAMRALAHDKVSACKNSSEILDWELDGVRIGRNALSLAVRRLRIGRLDLADARHRAVLEDSLVEGLVSARGAARIVEREKPTLALFNERGYSPAGEVFDTCLAAGVDCVQWFGAPQSEALAYKRYTLATRGAHPFSLGGDTWSQLQAEPFSTDAEERVLENIAEAYGSGGWYKRQQLQTGKPIFSRNETLQRLGVKAGRKVAVIFSHIFYDATFFYGHSLFADYEEWLVETVRCAIANPSLDWVVKVHPVNLWRSRMDNAPMEQLEAQAIEKALGPLPPHVRMLPADADINTYSLFSAIDYGVTVRGTIGMELPAFGIPVVTAGTGRYSGVGFTIDPATPEEYRAVLAQLAELPPLTAEAKRLARLYLWASFFRRPVPMQSFVLDFEAQTFGLAELRADVRLSEMLKRSGEFDDDIKMVSRWMMCGTQSEPLVHA